jgi:predicted nucleic acid-binding protein
MSRRSSPPPTQHRGTCGSSSTRSDQVSDQLVPFAARIDGHIANRWAARTYALIQQQLRNIGGRLGTGRLAVAETSFTHWKRSS